MDTADDDSYVCYVCYGCGCDVVSRNVMGGLCGCWLCERCFARVPADLDAPLGPCGNTHFAALFARHEIRASQFMTFKRRNKSSNTAQKSTSTERRARLKRNGHSLSSIESMRSLSEEASSSSSSPPAQPASVDVLSASVFNFAVDDADDGYDVDATEPETEQMSHLNYSILHFLRTFFTQHPQHLPPGKEGLLLTRQDFDNEFIAYIKNESTRMRYINSMIEGDPCVCVWRRQCVG